MGRYARRKGKPASCKGIGRRGGKTKTRTRDIDQIKGDLVSNEEFLNALYEDKTESAEAGQSYCVECARFFQSAAILMKHHQSKIHKQRVKKLKDWPID